MKEITFVLLLFITALCCGCEDLYDAANQNLSALQDSDDTDTDTDAPGPAVLTNTLTKGAESITLNWTDPTDEDLDHILIDWGTSSAVFAAGAGAGKVTGLSPLTDYTFTISAVDTSGNISADTALTIKTSASGDTEITGTTISNRTELAAISSDLTATYILIEDINLSSNEWTPLGSYDNSTPFTGTFDGGGHEISNMSITTEEDYKGLFAYTDGATVQYCDLKDVSIATAQYNRRGAAVGQAVSSTLKYLNSSGTIYGINHIGGIAGNCSACTISNCSSSTLITGEYSGCENGGGIIGYCEYSTVSGCTFSGEITDRRSYNGSIIGQCVGSKVSDCKSSGNLHYLNARAGGIIGQTTEDTTQNVVSGCSFSGTLEIDSQYAGGVIGLDQNTVVTNCSSTGTVSGNVWAGGLIGRVHIANTITIENCYATGAVSGKEYIGGLIGAVDEGYTISNCHAAGAVNVTYVDTAGQGTYGGGLVGLAGANVTFDQCYATGAVSTDQDYAGGLIGYSADGCSITSSYATGAVTAGKNYAGGLIGYFLGGSTTSTIEYCYATGAVTSSSGFSGGLIGCILGGSTASTIQYCYATGAVVDKGNYSSGCFTGGFLGYAKGTSATITVSDCFSRGDVTATGTYYANTGGFVGKLYNSYCIVERSYCTGNVSCTGTTETNGFVGYNSGSVATDCFYDSTLSTQAGSSSDIGGSGSNGQNDTTALTTLSTFTGAGWDFAGTWSISSTINGGYPYLTALAP